MTAKLAINGFGRIGRNVLRALAEHGRDDIEVVAINDLAPPATNAHLFRYDSVHGRFPGEAKLEGDTLHIRTAAGKTWRRSRCWPSATSPSCPGASSASTSCWNAPASSPARTRPPGHLGAGAKRVLVSAPADGADLTVVYGVNHDQLRRRAHRGQQRVLHHQLPGPGRQGAERRGRHRARPHDHDPLLHQRPEPARRLPQGPLPGPRRDHVDDPDLDRCRQGRGPGAARAQGQARRRRDPRADPNVSLVDLTFVPKRETTAEEINGGAQGGGRPARSRASSTSPRSRWSRSTSTTTRPARPSTSRRSR